MSRRGFPFPAPKVRDGFRQPAAIPISRMKTIKGIGVKSLTPIAPEPGMPPTGKFVMEMLMVKSDGQQVVSKMELHSGMSVEQVALEIHNGFQWLQTFLNCPCTPTQPCQTHRPAVEEQKPVERPTGIVLTDG